MIILHVACARERFEYCMWHDVYTSFNQFESRLSQMPSLNIHVENPYTPLQCQRQTSQREVGAGLGMEHNAV